MDKELTNEQILKRLKNGDVLSDHWKATRMFISTIEIPYDIGLRLIQSNTVHKYNDTSDISYYRLD